VLGSLGLYFHNTRARDIKDKKNKYDEDTKKKKRPK
jgi:hypothetical protein